MCYLAWLAGGMSSKATRTEKLCVALPPAGGAQAEPVFLIVEAIRLRT